MEKYQFVYGSDDDRVQRLNQTFCTYGKDVVYVEYLGGFMFRATSPTRSRFDVDIRDKQFSAEPFSLGWINQMKEPFYMSRTAPRQSRQGVVPRTVVSLDIKGDNVSQKVDVLQGLDYLWKGEYPTVTQAISSISAKEDNAVAISRDAVLFSDEIGIIKVMFHTDVVGWFSRTEGVCRVLDTPKAPWLTRFMGCLGLKVERGIEI